jgi:hypothetical protein
MKTSLKQVEMVSQWRESSEKEQIDNGELEMTRENKFIKWQVHKMSENAN